MRPAIRRPAREGARSAARTARHAVPAARHARRAVPAAQPARLPQFAARLALPPARLARAAAARPFSRHLLILACYLAAGVAVTWPRAGYLAGHELPATRDAGAYVWGFWWQAHQLLRLGNPWFTGAIAAPVGVQLGLHALMPLEGVLMTPVTLAFGPAASYNLLSAAIPGLACYATYRVGRLWLPAQAGPIAAGAFFGLSSMISWRSWYHLNLAAGAVFLPLALEAAVRLRRRPGRRQAVVLGLVIAASLLTDQESTVLAVVLVLLALAPWLASRPNLAKLRAATLAALVAAAAGSPQLAAVASQEASGGGTVGGAVLAHSYVRYGIKLAGLIAPSPRVSDFGLAGIGALYYRDGVIYQTIGSRLLPTSEATPMFGMALTLLAAAGLAASWRRRDAWLLGLLWLGAAALALGPVLWIGSHAYLPAPQTVGGVRVSGVMPYTWFVRIPGLSGFREAGRLAELGLLPAALLAGAAAGWLRERAAPALVVVAAACLLEAGWPGNLPVDVMPASYRVGVMPTALPALDRPIAADSSGSIVVDFPFGICGGTTVYGARFRPEAQVLATADGHPRAVGFVARVPDATISGMRGHEFYAGLIAIWRGAARLSPAQVAQARSDARAMNVGWVLVWPQRRSVNGELASYWNPGVMNYLQRTGFWLAYQADGVLVYRVAPAGS